MQLEVRLAIVFLFGLGIGALINWSIYGLSHFSQARGPWSKSLENRRRDWFEFLPIVGWIARRGEAEKLGSRFWVRPILIELAYAGGMAALYWWEVQRHALWPPLLPAMLPPMAQLHAQFGCHALLIAFMTAATFIDFDEQTIPDGITIPGTLLALAWAAWLPDARLVIPSGVSTHLQRLHLYSPGAWNPWLDSWKGLAIGCLLILGWAIALNPARYTLRHGLRRWSRYFFASIVGRWQLLAMAAATCAAAGLVWALPLPREHWRGLCSAIIGLAYGGALVWGVRIAGWAGLGQEAMGFGDVTLMAMIGAFLGWQTTLIIFFLSPFAALLVSVAQFIITRDHQIAFGPYLCLAALYLIVYWPSVWDQVGNFFGMGGVLHAIVASCLLLMTGMLMLIRLAKRALGGGSH